MQHRSKTSTFLCGTLKESVVWSFDKDMIIWSMFSRGIWSNSTQWRGGGASRCLATRGFDHLITIWSSLVKESVQDMITRQSIWSRSTQSRLRRGGGAAMSDWCSATSKAAIHLEREAIDRSRLVKVCHDWSSLFSTSHDRSLLVMIGKRSTKNLTQLTWRRAPCWRRTSPCQREAAPLFGPDQVS